MKSIFVAPVWPSRAHRRRRVRRRRPRQAPGSRSSRQFWEPLNFGKDINLHDVFFVSPEEGWVVGDKNTVLYTTDGGKTWDAQLGGDPYASDRELTEVFFLNGKRAGRAAAPKSCCTPATAERPAAN
jgi:hypothetical protein